MRGRFRSRHGRKILKTDDGLENPKRCHQHDHSSNRTAVDSLVYLIGLTIVEWNNLEIRIIVLTQGNRASASFFPPLEFETPIPRGATRKYVKIPFITKII